MLHKDDRLSFNSTSSTTILDHLTGLLRIEAMTEQEADEETKELLRAGNAKRFLGLS